MDGGEGIIDLGILIMGCYGTLSDRLAAMKEGNINGKIQLDNLHACTGGIVPCSRDGIGRSFISIFANKHVSVELGEHS